MQARLKNTISHPLTLTFKHVSLSFVFDALTIYENSDDKDEAMESFIIACHNIPGVSVETNKNTVDMDLFKIHEDMEDIVLHELNLDVELQKELASIDPTAPLSDEEAHLFESLVSLNAKENPASEKEECEEESSEISGGQFIDFVLQARDTIVGNYTDIQFDRFIYNHETDHDLYHQDDFSKEADHIHLKFKNFIHPEQLLRIIQILKEVSLIKEEEQQLFISALEQRYVSARHYLTSQLRDEKHIDAKTIIHFIKDCGDNDILADIYQLLMKPRYDYLRQHRYLSSMWYASNREGKAVESTEQWAKIENAFSLKLCFNILENCDFNAEIGKDHALQLAQEFPFFTRKHKGTNMFIPVNLERKNTSYKAFCKGDVDTLERKAVKRFGTS